MVTTIKRYAFLVLSAPFGFVSRICQQCHRIECDDDGGRTPQMDFVLVEFDTMVGELVAYKQRNKQLGCRMGVREI